MLPSQHHHPSATAAKAAAGLAGLLLSAAALSLTGAATAQAGTTAYAGAVFVETNATAGNGIVSYPRRADGSLGAPHTYATGGTGTGTGLGSQGALVLDGTGEHLYAVDAGSNEVSSFRVHGDQLSLVSRVGSGGTTPISVAVKGDRVYVLNAGGSGGISGFSVARGVLTPLPGSTYALSGDATGPAEVAFSPDRSQLVVTEKTTSTIDLFRLGSHGRPVSRTTVDSAGVTPFGFAFDVRGRLIVSEAGASTASSYRVRTGGLSAIDVSAQTTENAACWVVATEDGKWVYTGNGGGSNSVTGFREDGQGHLSLLDPDGKSASTTAGASDIALDQHSRDIYARLTDGTIAPFRVGTDGSLTALPVVAGLPAAGAAGIAAR